MDGDGHAIIHSGLQGNLYEDIYIDDNVWIASECMVLKGSSLRKNTIVAARGIVSKQFNEENILIGGSNKILKTDVEWRL